MKNIILNTDSYKTSHKSLYPPGTEKVTYYIEARGGKGTCTLFFGLQYFIKEYLMKPITKEDIVEARDILQIHGMPFDEEDWQYILEEYDGFLPLRIEALEEGMIVPIGTPLVQVTCYDPKLFWLPGYIETALLRAVWYPTSVATESLYCKSALTRYYDKCKGNSPLDYLLHDFGSRGATTVEASGIGGLAHLVNFRGTDNLPALYYGKHYYGEVCAGESIPASEHSVTICWGRDKEKEAYLNMLQQPNDVSIVIDSYDMWDTLHGMFCDEFVETIKNRGNNHLTTVLRPDSGDPVRTPLAVILKLMDTFGYTTNHVGYRTLNYNIKVLQGDGINSESVAEILNLMDEMKLSIDNIVFGMGGALLQNVNRDTHSMAMKANHVVVNGVGKGINKNPVEAPEKASKIGVQAVVYDPHNTSFTGITSIPKTLLGEGEQNLLRTVYLNGILVEEQELRHIVEKAESCFEQFYNSPDEEN